ncbi:MAG: hypothetical protein HYZ71_06865 [Deltaproteobacteria bacterium]|nr:hypothetical protein [Deltaproteobacteria bacterium]
MKYIVIVLLVWSVNARASIFGEENIPLYQILFNAIQQLAKMNEMLNQGKESLNLIREINKGINDSLNMIRTAQTDWNSGTYSEWESAKQAVDEIERIYGAVPANTSEAQVQKDADQSVAEAVALNNTMYDYSREIDRLGEEVKMASHTVSPGGAQKLTAETLGVMLHVMNSSLRAQATALKLQAQTMGLQNRQNKAETKHTLDTTQMVQREFNRKSKFQIPRF